MNNTTHHHTPTTKNNNNRSMSDSEYTSARQSPSQPDETSSSSSRAIVAVDRCTTTLTSPTHTHQIPPQTLNLPPPAYNRSAREDGNGGVGGGGGVRTAGSPVRRLKRRVMVDRSGLGFRVLEVVLSLIAFSVMASDKTQGWSGDSFDRYKEYRYVVAVNAIAFAYAAFQAIDMTYRLIYGNYIVSYSLRPLFDFLIDQILAYLLISASSSAATRVDDWVSNWGKDDFTEMATASIGMSFLAFLAFAISSLISGYNLCNQKSL